MSFEEPTLRNRLLLIASVIIAVAYAWLASSAANPELPQASHIIAGVYWRLDHRLVAWDEIRAAKPLEVARIANAVSQLEALHDVIPKFSMRPAIIVRAEPDVERVSEELIEISENKITSARILTRDLLQSWLLQRRYGQTSLFRYRATAEALTSVILDESSDELPLRMWLRFARPVSRENAQLDPFSFQPFLQAWALKVFYNVSPFDREELIGNWMKALKAEPAELQPKAATLGAWRAWLKAEMSALLPIKDDGPILFANNIAQLKESNIEMVYQAPDDRERGITSQRLTIVEGAHGARLYPAGVALDSIDDIETPLLASESCQPTHLADFLASPVKAEHFLFVQACADEGLKIPEALAHDGLYGMAKVAPNVPFLQLNHAQALFAERKGQIDRSVPLTTYMEKSSSKSVSLIGLETATWRPEMKAYRVRAPIEAIEWFRSRTRKAL